MATKKISQLTIGTTPSGSELFEMVQNTNSFSIPASGIKEYVLNGYAKISDVKAYNVNGGDFNSGAWRTRDLNTTDYDPNGIILSLSSNQFTLGPGTYHIYATCPFYIVGPSVARLYNTSDSSEVILGNVNYSSAYIVSESKIEGDFTITANKTFEIQHQSIGTQATNGFGVATNISGVSSVYTVVEIWKVN